MSSIKQIRIARRFQKAIRIDTDLGELKALDGFICPQSSSDALLHMANQVAETGHGAFTWTGPYGSGKSSLVVALGSLLNGNLKIQKNAEKIFGKRISNSILKALPPLKKGWRILPVIGRKENPIQVIGEALSKEGLNGTKNRKKWTEKNLTTALTDIAAENPNKNGGLILFIDEMGKFLEYAMQDATDIFLFQQLAEISSRSNSRFIIVGVLHQAFEEYANRLSHEVRDDWAKIQGRFIDLPINTAGEEQIDLISRAIENDHISKIPTNHVKTIANHVCRGRTSDIPKLASCLDSSWPLHPVVTCLLGPISRRRFGQNQRSIFGFLNSAEPYGFQNFLRHATEDDLYNPDKLWDYLRANLEPSILASPDGHRWALAAEALERCETNGGDAFHLRLLKTIAIVDLLKERSKLVPNLELLQSCFPSVTNKALKKGLIQLQNWSLIVFRKFTDAYAVFAGSDFNIDQAVKTTLEEIDEIDFGSLKTIAGLQPILAKRHYHDTGAMRWFDVNIAPIADLNKIVNSFKPNKGTIGQFLLAIPTEGENEETVSELCREASRLSDKWDIVVGFSHRSWAVVPLARELIALENIRNNRLELAGDSVARREIEARQGILQTQLESEIRKAFDGALWFRKHHKPKTFKHADLNSLASELADRRFDMSPHLQNELLNRQKPSSSAIAAQNALLRKMVVGDHKLRLGIEGYPAEGGLFASILEAPGIYAKNKNSWSFVSQESDEDKYCLAPLWETTTNFLINNKNRIVSISEIYEVWSEPPFGIKNGLMPILILSFILSKRNNLAIYREGIFRSRIDEVDVEHLAKDSSYIQIRWMDLTRISKRLLSELAEIVRKLDKSNTLVHLEPIDVARGLISLYDNLPDWTKRTMRLSSNGVRIRDLFKRAKDPNKFLFDDIPGIIGDKVSLKNDRDLKIIVGNVSEGLEEIVQAYPSMLQRLREIMLFELQVPNISLQSLSELKKRAENIKQLAGNFRLEAFISRLTQFDGSDLSMEGIASLAVNKPTRDWVDPNLDEAALEIAEMAQKFLRAETFARVKGRPEKRQSMAIILGAEGKRTPIYEEFEVGDSDRTEISELVKNISTVIGKPNPSKIKIILAALAELSAIQMNGLDKNKTIRKGKAKK